jgi:hypothetical protein
MSSPIKPFKLSPAIIFLIFLSVISLLIPANAQPPFKEGSFPGMLQKRTFHIVWVKKNHGVGLQVTADVDQTVVYKGKTIRIRR